MTTNYTPSSSNSKKNRCPSCGWETTQGFRFEQLLAGTLPENISGDFTAFRSTPGQPTTIEAGLLVPIGQTLMTAIVVTLPCVALALWLEWDMKLAFLIGAIAVLWQWIRGLDLHEKTLVVIEEINYSPGGQGTMQKSRGGDVAPVRLEVVSESNRHNAQMKIVDLPLGISGEQFRDFCKDILLGKSLARRDWVGRGKQFSRDAYDDLMGAMLEAGLVNNVPGKGKKLTVGGRHAITRLMQNG